MIKIFGYTIKIRLTIIVLAGLILLSLAVFVWFTKTSSVNAGVILGSLCAGLIVAIIQFIIAWQDYRQTEKLKELQLIKILLDRDKRDFYEKYVSSAKKNIDMMGVTGSRFMEHFANDDDDAPQNSKVLLEAMSKGVTVRILLPKAEFLSTEEEQRNEKNANARISRIKTKYPLNFLVKYFSHVPAHSIFLVDDECIIGPVFPDVSSKYTPALYLKKISPFVEKYLAYFNREWNNAE